MKWFGWKNPRDGARPALSKVGSRAGATAWGGGVPGGWPQGYEAQVREGYCRNPVAQRAVKLVAEAVAGAPLLASDPALAELVAARSTGQALLETIAAQLLLHGRRWRCSTSRPRRA